MCIRDSDKATAETKVIMDSFVRAGFTENQALDMVKTIFSVISVSYTHLTEGWSYDILKARLNIPCCKDVYYNLYRRFFWLLNKVRD